MLLPAGITLAQAPPSGSEPQPSGSAPQPSGSQPGQPGQAGAADAGSVYATCVEHLPEGARRPKVTERFPGRGLAGHALPLEIEIEHGAGESVLPHGFSVQASGVEADALSKAGFMVPSPDGGAPPRLEPIASAGGKGPVNRTKVLINVVALPKSAGRHEMTLPPLPIAVARASGEMMTLCTVPHVVSVEDPTANTPDARPRPNPPPRRQLETWEAAKDAFAVALVALVAAVAGALVYRWWRRRPRPVPPPPPPRPAWDVALESLMLLREGPLLREGRSAEFVDGVSDVVRRYLGEMFGFDGLEATSREVRRAVRGVVPAPPVLPEIDRLLDESDLVKFARVTPSDDDCSSMFELALGIVKRTIPAPASAPAPAAPPTASSAEGAPAVPAPSPSERAASTAGEAQAAEQAKAGEAGPGEGGSS